MCVCARSFFPNCDSTAIQAGVAWSGVTPNNLRMLDEEGSRTNMVGRINRATDQSIGLAVAVGVLVTQRSRPTFTGVFKVQTCEPHPVRASYTCKLGYRVTELVVGAAAC